MSIIRGHEKYLKLGISRIGYDSDGWLGRGVVDFVVTNPYSGKGLCNTCGVGAS